MTTDRLEAALRRKLADWPLVRRELEEVLSSCGAEEGRYLMALYAGLDPRDLAGAAPAALLADVRGALRARRELGWAVPEELFLRYVLPARINNEWPDGSRDWLYSQLRDRVAGLDMTAAALEVNGWCFSQATYTLADDRTIAPRGMCRRGKGRCGEESTLAAAALRAVGIPARQVYAPRWSHCDDNHAWVEFWAAGQWHYLGACEPEEQPDTGWFTSAASRAMLVRALAPDLERGGIETVNVTSRYAQTARLTVRAERGGVPLPGVEIRFQVVNDSCLCTIHREVTDREGCVCVEMGLGDLTVSAVLEGRLVERQVDLRRESRAVLSWEEGFDPLTGEREACWTQIPPRGSVPPPAAEPSPAFREKLRRWEAERQGRTAPSSGTEPRWLALCGGNREEIEKFLSLPDFSQEDKEAALKTLRDKDFADVTCAALADALLCALPWKGAYKPLVWESWVLGPRVENEPLLPVRCEIAARLAGEGLADGPSVLAWMDRNLRPVEECYRTDRRGDAAACLRHGVCPPSERQLLAVQLCRALGIPAFVLGGKAYSICPDGAARWLEGPADGPFACLVLRPGEEPLTPGEHFSLSRWEGEDYCPVELGPGDPLTGRLTIKMNTGAYRLMTTRRQIDGSLDVRCRSFLLMEDRTMELTIAPDRTAEKLLSRPLPSVKLISLSDDSAQWISASDRGKLLLFVQPGAEPTEHLLRELLDLAGPVNAGGWPVDLVLSRREDAENPAVRDLLAALRSASCFLAAEAGEDYALRRAMDLGDARLPMALVVDREGRGVYASANYAIRGGQTLMKIVSMLS